MNWKDRRAVCNQIAGELTLLEQICAQARPINFYLSRRLDEADGQFKRIHHYAETAIATSYHWTERELLKLEARKQQFCIQPSANDLFNEVVGTNFVYDGYHHFQGSGTPFIIEKQRYAQYSRMIREGGLYKTYMQPSSLASSTRLTYSSCADNFVDFQLLYAIEDSGCNEIGLSYAPNEEADAALKLKTRYKSAVDKLEELARLQPQRNEPSLIDDSNRLTANFGEQHNKAARCLRYFFYLATFCRDLSIAAVDTQQSQLGSADANRASMRRLELREVFYAHLLDYKGIPSLKSRK